MQVRPGAEARETATVTHERIWAPWRLPYIQGQDKEAASAQREVESLTGGDPNCFLCQAAAEPHNRCRYVVRCRRHCLSVLNRYPYNNGHLMVAPRGHRARLDELTADEQGELVNEITRMVGLLEKVLQPEGFNIGLNLGRAAGAGLPEHLHWHIVPRWGGDTNFMPTLASVKVIPQSLDALWEALRAEMAPPEQTE